MSTTTAVRTTTPPVTLMAFAPLSVYPKICDPLWVAQGG
nr:MAG TPA: hypothetical protein [Caudoviricetes sp.]